MRWIEVDLASETPIYRQLMDQIRARIRDRTLPPGGRLPSVRQLAGELGLNPNTVGKAYQFLENEGVLQNRSRKGSYVSADADLSASRSTDQRLRHAADRFAEEISRLGVSETTVLQTLRNAIGQRESRDRVKKEG